MMLNSAYQWRVMLAPLFTCQRSRRRLMKVRWWCSLYWGGRVIVWDQIGN
jgi:hypothetical protein